jgi:hypothetical protein
MVKIGDIFRYSKNMTISRKIHRDVAVLHPYNNSNYTENGYKMNLSNRY